MDHTGSYHMPTLITGFSNAPSGSCTPGEYNPFVFPVIQVQFSNYSYTVVEGAMVVDYSVLVWGYVDLPGGLTINITAFSFSAIGELCRARYC